MEAPFFIQRAESGRSITHPYRTRSAFVVFSYQLV